MRALSLAGASAALLTLIGPTRSWAESYPSDVPTCAPVGSALFTCETAIYACCTGCCAAGPGGPACAVCQPVVEPTPDLPFIPLPEAGAEVVAQAEPGPAFVEQASSEPDAGVLDQEVVSAPTSSDDVVVANGAGSGDGVDGAAGSGNGGCQRASGPPIHGLWAPLLVLLSVALTLGFGWRASRRGG